MEIKKDIVIKLLDVAKRATNNSYSPYSKFRVGASVLTAKGNIYSGANIENASFGLSLCAERVAISCAYSSGDTDIVAIAIVCTDAPESSTINHKTPCGACRQWIHELAPNATIIIDTPDNQFTIGDLLPKPFRL